MPWVDAYDDTQNPIQIFVPDRGDDSQELWLQSGQPLYYMDRGGGVVMKELDFDILEQSLDYQRDVNYAANGGSSETICSGTSEMQKKLFDTLYRWRIRK